MVDEPKRIFTIADLDEMAEICRNGDFHLLVGCTVEPDTLFAPKSWSEDLRQEWKMLLRQFGTGPALCFAVPLLTPYLRRRIDYEANFAQFNKLWDEHLDFLLANLSARWLVSTLDTYIKDPRTPAEEAWAFMGAFFMKSIKLYETENKRGDGFPNLLNRPKGKGIRMSLETQGRPMLFEGIQCFNVNAPGDMIDKMEARLMSAKSDELCYHISCALWRRAHANQTIYRRMQKAVARVNARKAKEAEANEAEAKG